MIHNYPNYKTEPFGFLSNVSLADPILSEVELFKVIDDYIAPGVKLNMYAISSYGRVFNIRSGRELSQAQDNVRYYRSLGLQLKDNSRRTFTVQRLVALAFVPKTYMDIKLGRDVVNHKDLCPWNNFYRNLEWTTTEENLKHADENNAWRINKYIRKTDTHWADGSVTAGENNGMARLSNDQVHQICKSLEEGKSRKQACLDAGLKADQNDLYLVSHILQGQRHRDIASQYDLPKARKQNKLTIEQLHSICKMLQDGKSVMEIVDILDDGTRSRDTLRITISNIKKRKVHTEYPAHMIFNFNMI